MEVSIDNRSLELLREFAPDLNKAMNKDIDKLLLQVVKRARGFVKEESPMSGWTPAKQGNGTWADKVYDQNTIQDGIGKTRASRPRYKGGSYQSRFAIFDATAAGVIYEGAGQKPGKRGKSTNPRQGKESAGAVFMRNIAERSGFEAPKHRMIVAALIEMRPDLYRKIDNVIDNAIREFNARMN